MDSLYKKAGKLLEDEVRKRQSLEKQARAVELAMKQVEMGLSAPFKTNKELQEKIASLMDKDLKVVEEALEMGIGSQSNVGKLEPSAVAGKDTDNLTHYILTGEMR